MFSLTHMLDEAPIAHILNIDEAVVGYFYLTHVRKPLVGNSFHKMTYGNRWWELLSEHHLFRKSLVPALRREPFRRNLGVKTVQLVARRNLEAFCRIDKVFGYLNQ